MRSRTWTQRVRVITGKGRGKFDLVVEERREEHLKAGGYEKM